MSFHPLYRGTWFPTSRDTLIPKEVFQVSIRYIAVLGSQPAGFQGQSLHPGRFHPLYRGTWFPTLCFKELVWLKSQVSIRYIAVLGSQPYQKNTPSDQQRRKRFAHPRRIDHIPTFASLNHDKNTRSTHYTPNAGIEFSQAGFAPPHVNPVQKWA